MTGRFARWRNTDEIILVPAAGAEFLTARPLLVEAFGAARFFAGLRMRLGANLAPAQFVCSDSRLIAARRLFPPLNRLSLRLHLQARRLERTLRTRISELEAADRHIAKLEEKILKLHEATRELKQLKQEKQALRKSPGTQSRSGHSRALSFAAKIVPRSPQAICPVARQAGPARKLDG